MTVNITVANDVHFSASDVVTAITAYATAFVVSRNLDYLHDVKRPKTMLYSGNKAFHSPLQATHRKSTGCPGALLMNENIGNRTGDANVSFGRSVDGDSGTSLHDFAEPLNTIIEQVENQEGCSNSTVFLLGFELDWLNLTVQILGGIQKKLQDCDQLVHLGLIDDVVGILTQAENLIVQDVQPLNVFLVGQNFTS